MDIPFAPIEWLWSLVTGRRRLRLAVHRAFFLATGQECYFVNATNLSKTREIEITHVWFDTTPPVHLLRPERPLPKRLKPDETWETWIEVSAIPGVEISQAFTLGRARLSNGKIIKSCENRNVPPVGQVPGG
jgi:hypothetical protein